jgi:hypothetical protein
MLDQPLSNRLREIRETHAPAASGLEPVEEFPERVPLGQLLIEKGLLTESDLGLALAHQRDDGRPLGKVLVGMGVITENELARTLTEQGGFDFSMSLRRRLSPVAPRPQAETDDDVPEPERYLLREPDSGVSLGAADSFLDAADAAFELIKESDTPQLEIVRVRGGEVEHLWSYHRDEADEPGGALPAA